jgi:hypothetical protein
MNHGVPATSGDYPNDLFIAIINFLVFGVGWYQCEVAWGKFLSFRALTSTDNRTVSAYSIYNRI